MPGSGNIPHTKQMNQQNFFGFYLRPTIEVNMDPVKYLSLRLGKKYLFIYKNLTFSCYTTILS